MEKGGRWFSPMDKVYAPSNLGLQTERHRLSARLAISPTGDLREAMV